MKKILIAFIFCLTTLPAWATQITNPFYISPKGIMTSTITAANQKFHLRTVNAPYARYRDRNRILFQNLTYGLSNKAALVMTFGNTWVRRNFDQTTADKTDSNINFSVGGLYDLYSRDAYYLQGRVLYLQKETHHLNGAYKALQANVRTGYDLKWILPYVGGEIELPIGQNANADNNPKYDAYAGLYKSFSFVSLDGILHYNYDKLYKSKKLYGHAQINFLLTEKVAIGTYFDYTFFDRGKNNADADGHTIGASVKIQF